MHAMTDSMTAEKLVPEGPVTQKGKEYDPCTPADPKLQNGGNDTNWRETHVHNKIVRTDKLSDETDKAGRKVISDQITLNEG